MDQLANIAFILGVIAYSAAATFFFVDLARRDGLAWADAWGARCLAAGVVCHGGHVVFASLFSRVCPVESVHFALSLAALVAALVYLWLRSYRGLGAMGVFVAPLSLTFLVAAQYVGNSGPPVGLSRTLLALHVTSNLVGFGLVLLAGAASVFYLVQERRLKAHRVPLASGRLPALAALEMAELRLLLVAFPLLTFGVVSGALFIAQIGPVGSASFVRAVLGYATWLLVAGVLVMRGLAGWRGRRMAYGTLAGMVCVSLVLVFYALRSSLGAAA